MKLGLYLYQGRHDSLTGVCSRLTALACGAMCLFASILSGAIDYPVKPVRFVVAYPAGAHADQVARLIGQKLTESMGRQFVVDNKGGAGGIIAEEIASRAAPDGYTILLVSISHVVNPIMIEKLSYRSMKDLIPVSLAVSVPNVLLVNNAVNVKSVPELIALAKAKPGELSFASSQGTSLYLAGELFKSMAGVNLLRVTYKSGGQAYPDIEAGRVNMAFSVITGALTSIKGGRTRILAVTSARRSPVAPELPAIAEFVPGYELTGWQGILAPAGTPREIVVKLSTEISRIMRMPDIRERLISSGADPVGTTPEQFGAFRQAEFEKFSKLLPKAGISAEY